MERCYLKGFIVLLTLKRCRQTRLFQAVKVRWAVFETWRRSVSRLRMEQSRLILRAVILTKVNKLLCFMGAFDLRIHGIQRHKTLYDGRITP